MKVLFLIDHAPDYRESFLRKLAEFCDLNILAHPCEKDNLKPPSERKGYTYYELDKTVGGKIRWNLQHEKLIKEINPDVICVALNLRYPLRIMTFLRNRKHRMKWIWWGQIFGRNDNLFLIRFKKYLVSKAIQSLVYTEDIKSKLAVPKVISFNNSQFSESEYIKLQNIKSETLNCLFVGRPQKRKRLNLLIDLAERRKDISIRIVGPGTKEFFNQPMPPNVELYPSAHQKELVNHFKWSNVVLNPGHVGLLAMNAACHRRPIIIDSKVNHAPEVILAKEANQYFVDFNNTESLDGLLNDLKSNHLLLDAKGQELFDTAMKKYTIEKMADKHMAAFTSTHSTNSL